MEAALQLTDELLKLVPHHERAIGNKKHYEKLLGQQGNIYRKGEATK